MATKLYVGNLQGRLGRLEDSECRRHDFRPDAVAIRHSNRNTFSHLSNLSGYFATVYTDIAKLSLTRFKALLHTSGVQIPALAHQW